MNSLEFLAKPRAGCMFQHFELIEALRYVLGRFGILIGFPIDII